MAEHQSKTENSVANATAEVVHPGNQEAIKKPTDFGFSNLSIQHKLAVGAIDDPLEREVDAVADRVMRMPEQSFIQRKCASCEEDKILRKPIAPFIQKKSVNSGQTVSESVSKRIATTRGNGQPLPQPTQSFMENRFGSDFSKINIHTGREAIHLSRDIDAKAFAVGSDIYFNSGQYNPESNDGKHLLAHELTHTLQQQHNVLIRRSPQDWFQSTPNIQQWSTTEVQNEIDELEEWLGVQIDSSEETARISFALSHLRTATQRRVNRPIVNRNNQRPQQQNNDENWQSMADRLTTSELQREVLSLRSLVSNMTENSAENDQFIGQFRIYEQNLLRRQEILNIGRRAASGMTQLARDQIAQGGASEALALATLNNQAGGAFGVAFAFSFLSELAPGDLQDANDDLIRNPLQFYGGFLLGLPVGVWNGLTGLLEGLWGLVQFASNFTPSAIISNIGEEAAEYVRNPAEYIIQRRREYAQIRAIYDGLQQFGEELREDPTIILQLSSDLGEALGLHAATAFTEDFIRQSVFEKGRITGNITGIIVFEILLELLLAVTTGGVGNLIRGIGVIGQSARVGGRLASTLRRLMNASPAIRRLLRSLNIGEDLLDISRTTENVVDVAEDVVDISTPADNVIPFPSERVGTSPSPLPQNTNNPVTDIGDFRQRRQATEMPEAANDNVHFPNSEANTHPVPIEHEMPIAVGQTHFPENLGSRPEAPVASINNGNFGDGIPQSNRTPFSNDPDFHEGLPDTGYARAGDSLYENANLLENGIDERIIPFTHLVGETGEIAAENFLIGNGWDILTKIRNVSDNGIDIIARNSTTGRLGFFEVKSSSRGIIPNLSPAQADGRSFVVSRLQTAISPPLNSNWMFLDGDSVIAAQRLLDEVRLSNNMTFQAIGIDLRNGLLRISPW